MTSDILARAAEHWARNTQPQPRSGIRNWWQSPHIWRHINSLLGAENEAGQHAGFSGLIERTAGRRLTRAISVGCGTGAKEMRLIRSGIVEHFDLYEITEPRIALGIAEAEKLGISDKVTWHRADAFAECRRTDYDLVHWNNALHHMLDTDAAVAWSIERLKGGGIFAMDDFVGPSRFQWSDQDLAYAAAFRRDLPSRLMRVTDGDGELYKPELQRPTIEAMIAMDPTEAADSEAIVPAIRKRMPGATLIPTGGVIYQLATRYILGNFSEETDDIAFLKLGLTLDRALSTLDNTHYAVAIGIKP
jgi:SAM-dependent methyltransferase